MAQAQVQVKEMREHLRKLLSEVEHGREMIIMRRNEPIARLVPYWRESGLSSMAHFRRTIHIKKGTVSEALQHEREGARF